MKLDLKEDYLYMCRKWKRGIIREGADAGSTTSSVCMGRGGEKKTKGLG